MAKPLLKLFGKSLLKVGTGVADIYTGGAASLAAGAAETAVRSQIGTDRAIRASEPGGMTGELVADVPIPTASSDVSFNHSLGRIPGGVIVAGITSSGGFPSVKIISKTQTSVVVQADVAATISFWVF